LSVWVVLIMPPNRVACPHLPTLVRSSIFEIEAILTHDFVLVNDRILLRIILVWSIGVESCDGLVHFNLERAIKVAAIRAVTFWRAGIQISSSIENGGSDNHSTTYKSLASSALRLSKLMGCGIPALSCSRIVSHFCFVLFLM
jgi:hypothetical protein